MLSDEIHKRNNYNVPYYNYSIECSKNTNLIIHEDGKELKGSKTVGTW